MIGRFAIAAIERSRLARLGLALALVAVAAPVRWGLNGVLHDQLPFITFFAAVAIAAVFGGAVGGVAAIAASMLIAVWVSLSPQGAAWLPGMVPDKSLLFILASVVFTGGAVGLRRLQRLRASAESRLQRILDATAVAIIERNAEGEVTYANPAAIRMLQLKAKDGLWIAPGWKIVERNGEPEVPGGSPFARILRGETVAPSEASFTHPETGELLVLTGSSAPIYDRKGKLVGATTSLIDITAQRRTEAALAQRDIEYRVLAESSPQLSWSTDAEGRSDYFSPQWVDYTGVPAETQFGWGWLDVLHPEDLAATQAAWRTAVERDVAYDVEYRIRRHDGEYRWFKTRGLPVRDNAGKITRWFGSSTDIDDIVQARNLLASRVAEQDREQARIFELSDDLFGAGSLDGRLWLVNPAWLRLLGVDEATVLSHPVAHWMHPDDRPALDRLPQVLMSSGTVRRLESRLRTATGDYRWIAWNVIVEGDVIYTVGRDVTEAKAAEQALREANTRLTTEMDERRKAESALAQAQRLEAIGQLTGGIAHDFNNLLQVISGGLELLRTAGEARRERLMDAIGKAAVRGGELTRQLLSFARRQPLQPQVIDLAAQVTTMRDLLDRSLRGDVRVVTDFDPELWPVEVDPAQLELAVLNIAVNARDALPGGGVITISGRNRAAATPAEDDHVALSIADTGEGMSPEVLARVFEPFFTTKAVGRGSGLGLSQVYGFIKQAGGDVHIDSDEGVGTTVTLLLPRSHRRPAVIEAARHETHQTPLRGRRVLLVEDDEAVAALTREMLIELGATDILRAVDADEALKVFDHTDGIDLMISDILMPGEMNGADLAREIRQRRPDAAILLITAYAPFLAEHSAGLEGMSVLTKPFDVARLGRALSALLADQPSVDAA